MDGTFIQKLIDNVGVNKITLNNREYADRQVFMPGLPMPKTIGVGTLTAVMDYIETSGLVHVYIHIAGPKTVNLFGVLDEQEQRPVYLSAMAGEQALKMNTWMDPEEFVINVMAGCVSDESTSKSTVLKYVGNIKEEIVKNTRDDGVTQGATVKTGVVGTETLECPNPVVLRPFRTFVEVEQPASEFVLRLQNGPRAALFEADGGAWKVEAIRNIKEFFEEQLPMRLERAVDSILPQVTILA